MIVPQVDHNVSAGTEPRRDVVVLLKKPAL